MGLVLPLPGLPWDSYSRDSHGTRPTVGLELPGLPWDSYSHSRDSHGTRTPGTPMGLVPPWDSNSRDSHGTRTPSPGTPIATPRRDSHSYSHCHATPGSRHHALSSLRKNSSWESQVLWDSPRHGTVPGLHGSRHAALPGLVPLSHSYSRDSDSSTPGTRPTVPLVLPGLGLQHSRDSDSRL